MRTHRLVAGFLFLIAPSAALCQQADIPELHYQKVPEWPNAPLGDQGVPSGWNYLQVTSLAVEKNGNILLMHRGDDPILEYRPDGELIGPWGNVKFSQGKVMPVNAKFRDPARSGYQAVYGPAGCSNCGAHEIRVDPDGNVWAIDAPGHVITKMDPQGHILMTLGRRGTPGMTNGTFYLPTDVAFAPNGELVVTDGYGNPRVVRFSHDGQFLGQFGVRGNGPGQFQLPHNVVIDAHGNLYVADRDNQRVEVFDASGKFLSEWDHVGALSSLVMTKDQHVWAGGVLRDLNGKAIGRLPGEGADSRAHGAAVADNGDVYFGLLSGIAEKFTPQ